jgi:hypothetical protein
MQLAAPARAGNKKRHKGAKLKQFSAATPVGILPHWPQIYHHCKTKEH